MSDLAKLYAFPLTFTNIWLRVIITILWWAILTGMVVLAAVSWFLLIGWWWKLLFVNYRRY